MLSLEISASLFPDASRVLQHVTITATQPNYVLECGGVLIFSQYISVVL